MPAASNTRILNGYMSKPWSDETVFTGIQPDIALSMVQLGLPLGNMSIILTLEEDRAYLNRRG